MLEKLPLFIDCTSSGKDGELVPIPTLPLPFVSTTLPLD